MKIKVLLLAVMVAVISGLGTGCFSCGMSYEKHYSNPLGRVVPGQCAQPQAQAGGTNGPGAAAPTAPQAPVIEINGAESYEKHKAIEWNPLDWLKKEIGSVCAPRFDGEVVVSAPALYYQQPVQYAPPPVQYGGYPQNCPQGSYHEYYLWENGRWCLHRR